MEKLRNLNTEKGTKYICLTVLFLVITLLAWQADDAFHAYKMACNFANGNGLVYNVGERVSASTCPLHTIIVGIVYKVFDHIYLSSLFLCILYSVGAIAILFSVCKSKQSIIIATILLVFCKSFISYTTSGMENPLLFLLFAIYARIYFTNASFNAKRILLSSLVASLILMTRMDNALLAFPMMLFVLWKRENMSLLRAFLYGCVGLLPFIAWEIFSLLYYGFPFPNTAYAKLAAGVPLSEYFVRGIGYFVVTLFEDPVVLVFPVLFIVKAIISKSAKYLMPAVGIVLYYGYIIYIGGDYMFGRHFTVPFFIALFCLFTLDWDAVAGKIKKTLIACVALQLLVTNGVIYYAHAYGQARKQVATVKYVVADERAEHFQYTLLFFERKNMWGSKEVDRVRASGHKGDIINAAAGMLMLYYDIDGLYLNDPCALGDPLLARLPAYSEPEWRSGHLARNIPDGYRTSVQTGINQVKDPNLHEYLDVLWEITRSKSLFSKGRLEKIININLGRYDYLLERYVASPDNNINSTDAKGRRMRFFHTQRVDPQEEYDFAIALMESGRNEDAMQILEQCVLDFPFSVLPYPLLINHYVEVQNYNALYRCLTRLKTLHKQQPEALMGQFSPEDLDWCWQMLAELRQHIN
ncbi:hypothetical protein AGMMS4957_13930 [Bacteroidia bacterium]|nr:hypothetical protein AGMMS4957_13930 [Bacteroidia bacterium]